MLKLKNFARERVWTLAALLISSLLVWFFGDAVSLYGRAFLEAPAKRFALILLLWLVFFSVELASRILDRRSERKMANELIAPANSMTQSDEKQIQEAFAKAVQALQQDYNTRHGRWNIRGGLYQLPWYVLIGPPGSGKTTTLVNSSLNFLLGGKEGKQALKGVGGTRLCDWWFTDQAVLIDTAGRFTTQTSDKERDNAGWMSFLQSLKKNRGLQPLNGIIVVLSVAELMDEAKLAHTLDNLRLRLREIQLELSHRLPVYLIINKMDMLQGFSEFFSLLDQDARNKVWGFTAAPDAHGELRLSSEFVDQQLAWLHDKLSSLRLIRMDQEANLAVRSRILLFPEQFRLIQKSIKTVYSSIVQGGEASPATFLRGIYFTSATQHGTAIDKVLAAMGMPRTPTPANTQPTGKSFFINDLLQKIVFTEAGLVSETPLLRARRKKILIAACLLPALFLAGSLLVWTVSYAQSKKILLDLEGAYNQALSRKEQLNATELLSISDYLAAIERLGLQAQQKNDDLPLSGLGINALSEYGDQATYVYKNSLRAAFARLLYGELELQLKQPGDNRYQLLKTYLAFADRHPVNEASLATVLVDRVIVPKTGQLDQSQRAAMIGHVVSLLQARPLIASEQMDMALVNEARNSLKGGGLADVAYSVLQERMSGKVKDFISSDAVGAGGVMLFSLGSGKSFSTAISGMYTREGYNMVVEQELNTAIEAVDADRQWVLGDTSGEKVDEAAGDALKKQVLERYLRDYAATWDQYARNIRMSDVSSLGDALQQTKLLTESDSVLIKMLAAIVQETSLTREAVTQGRVQKAMAAVSSLTRDDEQLRLTRSIVDSQFEQLYGLLYAPEKKAELDELMALFSEISKQFYALDEAGKTAKPAPDSAELSVKIRSFYDKYPAPVSGVLHSYYVLLGQFSKGAMKQGLANELTDGVSSVCKQVTANRYPLSKSSGKDIEFADFGKLFSPSGLVPVFFDKNIRSYIDTTSDPWRPRPGSENSLDISAESLANFQRADAIKSGFFQSAGNLPFFSFDLRWLDVPPGLILQQVRFEADGQSQSLEGNSVQHFNWPALPGGNHARLVMNGQPLRQQFNFNGPWSILRFIDSGNPVYLEGGRQVKLKWSLPEGTLAAEIKATSLNHPFIPKVLGGFRCPSSL